MAKYVGETESGAVIELTHEEVEILKQFRHNYDVAVVFQPQILRALVRLHDMQEVLGRIEVEVEHSMNLFNKVLEPEGDDHG